MALTVNTQVKVNSIEHGYSVECGRNEKCPLHSITQGVPVKPIKKSVLTVYMTVMMDVFSHSSWNGW